MIGIARHTDYAARIVLHLACLAPEALVPIAEIAARRLLPTPFVRRVVGKLVGAGILATVRGAAGGVRLGRAPADISLLDVVRAVEGGIVLNRCVETHAACPFAQSCPVHDAWTSATRALESELDSVRFADLANRFEGHVAAHRHAGPVRAERARRATPAAKR